MMRRKRKQAVCRVIQNASAARRDVQQIAMTSHPAMKAQNNTGLHLQQLLGQTIVTNIDTQ